VGRVRERVKLCEMRRGVSAGHWRGCKKGAGRVGGCRGREIRRRARVRMRRSTASAKGAELTGQAHDTEREERGARGNGSATSGPGPRDRERGRERAGEENWHRQVGPNGQRAREGEQAWVRVIAADRRGPPVRRRERAAWLGRATLVWAAFSFSFSLNFLIPFPFLFL
jgi:hypothetical protein